MAGLSSISSIFSYVLSHNNKTANLKTPFTYRFDIQIADLDLLNKWVTYRLNVYTITNVKDYEL